MNNVERMIAGLRCCAANKNVCAAVECPLFELCQANKINPLLVAAEMMEALKAQKEAAENGLADLEAKLAELLCHVTGGRFSKAAYSIEEMKRFADDFRQEECEKCEEMEQVKRERDAAVADVKSLCATNYFSGDYCAYCKHRESDGQCFHECTPWSGKWGWEWRGAQEGER